jgi:hypothetical protein
VIHETWQEKLHGFVDPQDDKTEQLAAIGRLVTAMNGIDVILTRLLMKQFKKPVVGRAMIGGMRTGDMLSSLKRIAKVTRMSPARQKKLESVCQDIESYKTIRDDVAHKIWAFSSQGRMGFSNAHVSRFEDSANIAIYTHTELNELASYARYLSLEIARVFPRAFPMIGQLPSRNRPALLDRKDQNQNKGHAQTQRSARSQKPQRQPSRR